MLKTEMINVEGIAKRLEMPVLQLQKYDHESRASQNYIIQVFSI